MKMDRIKPDTMWAYTYMKPTRIKPDTLKQTMKRQYKEWHENVLNDEELYTKILERFEDFLDELDEEDNEALLEIVNTYRTNQNKPLIYYNEDDTLNEYLYTPAEAIKACDVGEFDYYQEFVSFFPLTSYSSIPYIEELGDIFIDIMDFPEKYDVDLIVMSEDASE